MTLQERLRRDFSGWRTRMPPAWRPYFDVVELGFDAVDPKVEIRDDEQIWPMGGNGGPDGADTFKSLRGLTPEEVRVVIFGNDPYTKLRQATGRSFEQGDVRDWHVDIKEYGRISPSLQTLLCAAAATSAEHADFDLKSHVDLDPDDGFLWRGHQELARGLVTDRIRLPRPEAIFDHWAAQGVLWLNRTLTYSRWMDDHRPNHTVLWAPFTARVIQVVLEAASRRGTPVVFALWGAPAQQLRAPIEAEITARGLHPAVARFVVAAHPQMAGQYFRDGNPLERINELLADRPVRWL